MPWRARRATIPVSIVSPTANGFMRSRRPDRPVGAAHRLRRGRQLARACAGRHQRLADPVQVANAVAQAALAETGLDPRRLELEITEAVLIADDDAALVALNQLRALGVHIALDDFGTGYSSLQYLQRFPLDKSRSTAVLSRKSPATPAWRRSSARSSALPPTAT